MMKRKILCAALLALVSCRSSLAQEANSSTPALKQVVERGLSYLRDKGQNNDGTLSPRIGSGVTSLAVTAALRHGQPLDDPLVARGLAAMDKFVQPDGGIYGTDRLRNYETCVAIVCFAEANRVAGDGRYDKILQNADKYVRGLQYGAAGDVDQSDVKFGGVGYSGPERPDLSNTAYLIDALHSLGATGDDPAIQRALVFVSRCQNLEGKWNDTPFADKVNDGGFYYVIPSEKVDTTDSERVTPNGGLRSYGSMTYAGFKSLLYADLTKNDPRTQAALKWIRENYSVTENPGQGTAGLFYYYQLFGSALGASQLDELKTKIAGDRSWREDLIAELSKTQRPDGSWMNANRQWMENDPNLCTAFALLALAHCNDKPSDNQKP
jgi:squalene-hopene/tetraprenyl-beta-curcumene cyclase